MESAMKVGDPTWAEWPWEVGEWNRYLVANCFFHSKSSVHYMTSGK